MITPVIVITHAGFDPSRVQSLNRLMGQLRSEAPDLDVCIARDDERKGSLWCWKEAMKMGLEYGASHVVWLPDDAIVCKHFGRILRACIEARPDDVFDCFVNHKDAYKAQTLWYTTPDGYVGFAGVMPRHLLKDHLYWRSQQPALDVWPNDAGVNTWAMATGRLIYKTHYTLAKHDLTVSSLDGHDGQAVEREGSRFLPDVGDVMNFLARTWMAPEEHCPGQKTSCTALGKTYERTHMMLLELSPPAVEAYWDVQRGHKLSGDVKSVFIATPAYMGDVKAVFAVALLQEMRAAHAEGVSVGWSHIDDSAVDRCRNRLVAQFMKSDATHLLFWDGDNVPTKPGWIKLLLDTGHDIVGGAVVQKNGTGKDFAMQLVTGEDCKVKVDNGCIRAFSLGTGFMMISRRALVRMMIEYIDQWYVRPEGVEWNLFSGTVHNRVHCAEDYEFCRKWRMMGEYVYILPDIDFTHVGLKSYEGSFSKTVLASEEKAP